MISRLFILATLPLLFASGCTTSTAYLSLQEMQRDACEKNSDMQERQRCRAQANTSYDDYKQQREAAKTAR
ncbi:hypothetical protein TSA66_01665 [Noviherbaspirillum autotrophicum]|uniref:Lipoprotein n=1 Tax=Noviherbaspirillum autotrophicum TaxID=709839 RepID=A0A0C2BIK5_9BURK|nr:hypothetical protein TSA66_01665 [Noviherbaspirillum autotrophicum]